MSWLRHPVATSMTALVVGVLMAVALLELGPTTGAWIVPLPAWLIRLSSDGAAQELAIARPNLLWLVPLALLPYLAVVAHHSLVDLPVWQLVLQLVLRVALIVALACAISFPSTRAPVRGKTLALVLDVSESVSDGQLHNAEALVEAARTAVADEIAAGVPEQDRTRLRVVSYAARARVLALEHGKPLALVRPEHALASDHAGALQLARAMIDPDTEARMVLVSDGTGSLAEREQLATTVRMLERSGTTVHTRSFAAEARGDVIVDAVHLPNELRIGQTFDVVVDVVSTHAGHARIRLDKNGDVNAMMPFLDVDVRSGRQSFELPTRVTEPGPVVFTASIVTDGFLPEHNRSHDNDAAGVVGDVKGRPRVLLASVGDATAALPRALRADHLDVEGIDPSSLPTTPDQLRPYDLVMLSDVPSRRVSSAQQHAIATWVKEGGGFIMVGGENSFGVGKWNGTVIEDVLPVRFEGERQREQPTLALVLVIDKSGSMSSEDKLDLVKEAARATARTLDPTDELAVVAFDSRPHVLVRLQPASNRVRISSDIRRLSAGGGTHALPALREAYLQLSGSRALVKHVILLSDGQSPEMGVDALLADMRDADVTVSTIGVGAGAGKDFLSRVAERGRGRYYFSHDGTDVPRIFSRETSEVTRNAVVERLLFARVTKPVQALQGIDFAHSPGLHGIVPIQAKPMAEVLLRTHLGDALLVRGRRGLGRTVAFASDAKPRWAASWIPWSGFPKLWSQIVRDTVRQGVASLGGANLSISPAAVSGTYHVVVDLETGETFANDLSGDVIVSDPAIPGSESSVALELTAPGRYEAVVHDIRSGQRLVRAKLFSHSPEGPRLAAEASSHVSMPYPAELAPDQLVSDPKWLASITTLGATSEGDIGPIVTAPGEAGGRTRMDPLWPEVLLGLVLPIWLLDLVVRRVALGRRRLAV